MSESKNTKGGIVYILTNEAMPGYIKIGKTSTSIGQRIVELSRSSAVPLPFECYYAAKVSDMNKVERALHDAFGDHRKNPRREFFTLAPERVYAVLSLLAQEDVTPSRDIGVESNEDRIAIEVARKKRSAFNFKMVDIPAGAELKFVRNEAIMASVAADQKHIIYNGRQVSVSEAAAEILKAKWWVKGPAYWTYEGEILDERRDRMEAEAEESAEQQVDEYLTLQGEIARGK